MYNNKKSCLIYVGKPYFGVNRVNRSTDLQTIDCKKIAKDNNLKIEGIFSDPEPENSALFRKGLISLLEKLENSCGIDYIVVTSPLRLGGMYYPMFRKIIEAISSMTKIISSYYGPENYTSFAEVNSLLEGLSE